MTRVTVKIIDAIQLPESDPRMAGIPPWCTRFNRPDLPADVGFRDAEAADGVVTVSIEDADAARDDVQAAIKRAQ